MKSASMLVGIDIVEIHRIKDAVSRWKDAFLKRVYAEEELEYCEEYAIVLVVGHAA